jgi:hypothetical protein
MATSVLYEVPDSARELLSSARAKGEWYDALGNLTLEEARSLDGEDSFAAWEFSISQESSRGPFASFFTGDLRSEEDDTGDPHVVFHGAPAVAAIAEDFRVRGEEFFREMLERSGHELDVWLYARLAEFLAAASARRSGIVVLWEG